MTEQQGTLGIVGAGTMGAGIAQVALEAGWRVRLHDALPGATDRGRKRIADGLRRRAAKRGPAIRAEPDWIRACLARLADAPNPAAVASGADLVIEAIVEDLEAKQTLVADLDAAADPATILATNTSALSVSAIAAAAAGHPERVLGLHFFNPAPVLVLVEVVAGQRTDAGVLDRVTGIVGTWGKTAVRCADSPGFVVNRVNRPFTIEALRMIETGEARAGEIDAAVRADGFPMGPFELMDLVGLDVSLAAATGVWEGLGRPERLRPSPIQAWLVEHRRLGRKTGLGFYRYNVGHDPVVEPLPHAVARPVRAGHTLAPGAVVERIRTAIAAEAVLARDAGVASEADIDTALWLGAAHPEGPFAWLRRQGAEVRARTIGA
ncbi:MAG TPA: 3-hydroxyacyl-CoA dehydrogenase NAD-binding domain-containing protein [Candidatus Limnocylindrales bacterium]|nr:3-hydroxyacyl-CoA dehydrogenase NAD-binding domain-containing protein [Candidatus Limnocylindrales bacterium]